MVVIYFRRSFLGYKSSYILRSVVWSPYEPWDRQAPLSAHKGSRREPGRSVWEWTVSAGELSWAVLQPGLCSGGLIHVTQEACIVVVAEVAKSKGDNRVRSNPRGKAFVRGRVDRFRGPDRQSRASAWRWEGEREWERISASILRSSCTEIKIYIPTDAANSVLWN